MRLFDIPARPDQSCEGAREAYRVRWSRDWPYDDNYLRQLARDVGRTDRCESLLMAMRECHEFEPFA